MAIVKYQLENETMSRLINSTSILLLSQSNIQLNGGTVRSSGESTSQSNREIDSKIESDNEIESDSEVENQSYYYSKGDGSKRLWQLHNYPLLTLMASAY